MKRTQVLSSCCRQLFTVFVLLACVQSIVVNASVQSTGSENTLGNHADEESNLVKQEVLDETATQAPNTPAPLHRSGWTAKPECTRLSRSREKYCLYTNSHFANNRGISIITTPDRVDEFLNNFIATTNPGLYQSNTINQLNSPQFFTKEIDGHGIGLIANRTIEPGERLMSFTPALVIAENARKDLLPSERHRFQHIAVSRFSVGLRQSIEALYGQAGSEAEDFVDDIIDTNAFSIPLTFEDETGVDDDEDEEEMVETYSMLFPEIGRFNHACRPGADYFFDVDTFSQHVMSSRRIAPGEEITITYIDPLMRRKARVRSLKRTWGFTCDCNLCQASPDVVEASDILVDKILELQEEMSDRSPYSEASPTSAEMLIDLIKQEQAWTKLHEAYAFAAFEYNGVAESKKAQSYAALALQYGASCRMAESRHNDQIRQDLLDIKRNPMNHSSWGFRLE